MSERKKKILSPEEKLIKAYCRHISRGYSENSFPDAEAEDVERLARETDEKSGGETHYYQIIGIAKRQSRLMWERIGLRGILGKEKKFNGSAWMFVMKNRFGWKDKLPEEIREEEKVVKVKLGFEGVYNDENI